MISAWVVAFLTAIGIGNLLLFMIILRSCSGELDKATKIGFTFMNILLVLNTFALFGGVKLW